MIPDDSKTLFKMLNRIHRFHVRFGLNILVEFQ
jgi:hypothetical protein